MVLSLTFLRSRKKKEKQPNQQLLSTTRKISHFLTFVTIYCIPTAVSFTPSPASTSNVDRRIQYRNTDIRWNAIQNGEGAMIKIVTFNRIFPQHNVRMKNFASFSSAHYSEFHTEITRNIRKYVILNPSPVC